VIDRQVEVYLDPTPNGYKFRATYAFGEKVPFVVDGVNLGDIAVDDLMP
jgi:hypothetical protein